MLTVELAGVLIIEALAVMILQVGENPLNITLKQINTSIKYKHHCIKILRTGP